jgi:hypothetical protein
MLFTQKCAQLRKRSRGRGKFQTAGTQSGVHPISITPAQLDRRGPMMSLDNSLHIRKSRRRERRAAAQFNGYGNLSRGPQFLEAGNTLQNKRGIIRVLVATGIPSLDEQRYILPDPIVEQ